MGRKRRSSPQAASLLAVLAEKPRSWRYGYELSQETQLESGTLYPILMRLSDQGVLESKWEPSPEAGRPPRHMYRLTPQGVAYAKEETARYAEPGKLGMRHGVAP
jgi:PadR family transcriptional regulator, regulatory protein PadR